MIQRRDLGAIEKEIGGRRVKFRIKGIKVSETRNRGESVALGNIMPLNLFRTFRMKQVEFFGVIEDINGNVYRCGKIVNKKDYYQPFIIWEPILSMDIFAVGVRVRFMVSVME